MQKQMVWLSPCEVLPLSFSELRDFGAVGYPGSMSRPAYPIPDRSNFHPNAHRTDALPEGDVGSSDAALADGRPYRVESWYTEGMTLVTCFLSNRDLENASAEQLLEYIQPILERCAVPADKRRLASEDVHVINDASDQPMFSLTFLIGSSD